MRIHYKPRKVVGGSGSSKTCQPEQNMYSECHTGSLGLGFRVSGLGFRSRRNSDLMILKALRTGTLNPKH